MRIPKGIRAKEKETENGETLRCLSSLVKRASDEGKGVLAPKRGHTPKADFRSAFLFFLFGKNIFVEEAGPGMALFLISGNQIFADG